MGEQALLQEHGIYLIGQELDPSIEINKYSF